MCKTIVQIYCKSKNNGVRWLWDNIQLDGPIISIKRIGRIVFILSANGPCVSWCARRDDLNQLILREKELKEN